MTSTNDTYDSGVNPFYADRGWIRHDGMIAKPGWYFRDETGCEYGPFVDQRRALMHLLKYIDWLDKGPSIWQRVWWPIRYTLWPAIMRFCHDTRGAR